jgi:hypothetical protein
MSRVSAFPTLLVHLSSRAWNQPIATITIPALISTVAEIKTAVSNEVMIQYLRMPLLPRCLDELGLWHNEKTIQRDLGATWLLRTSPIRCLVALRLRLICNRLGLNQRGRQHMTRPWQTQPLLWVVFPAHGHELELRIDKRPRCQEH